MSGYHDLNARNQDEEDFLELCEINQMSFLNNWFQKKKQHYGSWLYPSTRYSSIIDLVLSQFDDHRFCTDN